MTAFEILSLVIAIISLLIGFGKLIIAIIAYIDKQKK